MTRSAHLILAGAFIVACSELRESSIIDGGATQTSDAGSGDAAIVDMDVGPTYLAAQKTLQALRIKGPTTTSDIVGACTGHSFVWTNSDTSVHSWSPSTNTQIDYTFTAPAENPFLLSDVAIIVQSSSYTSTLAYDPTMKNSVLSTFASAESAAGTDDGAILLDVTTVNGNSARQPRHWVAATNTTTDFANPLPLALPIRSVGLGEAIVNGPTSDENITPIYILDLASNTMATLTHDNGTDIFGAMPSSAGLIVTYAKPDVQGIRLYSMNAQASQIEVADAINALPNVFSDGPPSEHAPLAIVTLDGSEYRHPRVCEHQEA